jgi:hypothetical protein
VDLSRFFIPASSSWNPPQPWPTISLAISGDGQNVLTHGQAKFTNPLPFEIEPWNIPTNLIHEPVQSFTAVQGLRPWLASLPAWHDLQVGAAPNRLFCWAQNGSPFLDYAAAPLVEPARTMAKLGPKIMDAFNPVLATNRMGKWERDTNSDGVVWNAPVMNPFVKSMVTGDGRFLLAGLSPYALTNSPSPVGTFGQLLSQKNLVYYDQEITGPRIEAWLYISQLSRIILRRAQLPPNAASIAWLRSIGPFLGNSITTVTKATNRELSAQRTSTIGLTGLELHLLVDWLESPEFPGRPHTVVAKLRPIPAVQGAKQ